MSRRPATQEGPFFYTTFEVARLLGVSPPTVVNWVNGGLLTAHRTPGGHRRIAKDDFLTFARDNGFRAAATVRAPATTPTNAVKVLVVDDNRDLSELVRNFFIGRTGYDVEVADSGFAAGLTVARFRPQVILMDILMPEMDGFEVLRQLQDHPDTRDIPVIAWTAYHDARIEARVRREAFVAYVKKSEPLERLAAVVDRAVIKGAVREPG